MKLIDAVCDQGVGSATRFTGLEAEDDSDDGISDEIGDEGVIGKGMDVDQMRPRVEKRKRRAGHNAFAALHDDNEEEVEEVERKVEEGGKEGNEDKVAVLEDVQSEGKSAQA